MFGVLAATMLCEVLLTVWLSSPLPTKLQGIIDKVPLAANCCCTFSLGALSPSEPLNGLAPLCDGDLTKLLALKQQLDRGTLAVFVAKHSAFSVLTGTAVFG